MYVEAAKTGQRFMGSVIEWLLNTCQNLRRLSISEGGGGTEKFKQQRLRLSAGRTNLNQITFLSLAANSNLVKTSGVQNAEFYTDLIYKSRETLTEATFWTFEDLLLPALQNSQALKKLTLENSFTLTPLAFTALKSMTNLEDLSLKAENSKDLCAFL